MPELPEVQTVIDTLKPLILGTTIKNIEASYPKIIENDYLSFQKQVIAQRIVDINRHGKFIIVVFSQGFLVIHLRMEGKFYVVDRQSPWLYDKHSHVRFYLDNGQVWVYHDVRKFGRIGFVEHLHQHPGLQRLGLDVFDQILNPDYLFKAAKNRSIAIKTFLLDQSVIAGIGNIYANEILFDSKISPFQPANTIFRSEFEKILQSTIKIMTLALNQGGTTIRSYTSSLGVSGLFQQSLMIHNKEKEACHSCQQTIKRVKISGRSSFYCPNCQTLRRRKGRS